LRESDVAALYTMGLHSVLLNTYCRTAGYCRNDYRKILEEPAATQVEEGAMADIVMAYCSSHGPMMAAARDAAPSEQGDAFFGAERRVRDLAAERGVQALVAFLNHQGHFAMAEPSPTSPAFAGGGRSSSFDGQTAPSCSHDGRRLTVPPRPHPDVNPSPRRRSMHSPH
jgi:hypothetical protein